MIILLCGKFSDVSKNRRTETDRTLVVVVLILLFGSFSVTGWRFPMHSQIPVSQWFKPAWVKPAEIKYLEEIKTNLKMKKEFARLGPNDDNGLAGFMDDDWRLVCRHYAQYGHETVAIVDEIVNCISKKPNYVFVSPGFLSLERLNGTYAKLKNDASQALIRNFKCYPIDERPGAQFCIRLQNKT
jgi:hypothetical protein